MPSPKNWHPFIIVQVRGGATVVNIMMSIHSITNSYDENISNQQLTQTPHYRRPSNLLASQLAHSIMKAH
jgi:hypothetical protein